MEDPGERVTIVGVAHYRVELADVVRRTISELAPAAVAVELPSTLQPAVMQAVRRLPLLSVVVYGLGSGETVYLPIEPTDPLVEAVRSADELGIPVSFVDLDLDAWPSYRTPVPDPYAILRLGYDPWAEAIRAAPRERDIQSVRREKGMAARVARLARETDGAVLLVCSIEHVDGVRDALVDPVPDAQLAKVRRESVSIFHLHPECLAEVLGEMPLVASAYELHRSGRADAARERAPEAPPAEVGHRVGPFRVIDGSAGADPDALARAVARIAAAASRPTAAAVSRTASTVSAQRPYPTALDRMRLQAALFDEAAARSGALGGEALRPWQRRSFAAFTRRLAAAGSQLVPDLFDLVVAGRGCVDENFAHELWQLGTAYPWQEERSTLPTARISGEELLLGTRRIRLRPRVPRPGRRAGPFPIRRRRGERFPGEFLAGFTGEGVCSYPPEDIVVEGFGRRMKERGRQLLRDEHATSVRFMASLEDGIDVRETIRRFAEGDLFVRRAGRSPGDVGSVVVVFEDDPDGTRYPYTLTWLGEHAEESDMAFFATDPREKVVGPGICRSEYGGFLLSYPPRRMLDVWTDRRYDVSESKAERLILAALDYSEERLVVLVAPRPPSARMRDFAARLDRRLVYLPIGSLAPSTRKRLRVLHVLDGHSRRDIARDYVL